MMKFDTLGRKSGSESLKPTELFPHYFDRTSLTSSTTFDKSRTTSQVQTTSYVYSRIRLQGQILFFVPRPRHQCEPSTTAVMIEE
jgi:hypothetical protein